MKRFLQAGALAAALLWSGTDIFAETPTTDDATEETTTSLVPVSTSEEGKSADMMAKRKESEPSDSKPKRNWGRFSGSFETNTIFYQDDSKTGAIAPPHHYGSNNYLKLDYQLERFSAGLQVEYYPQPLLDMPGKGLEYLWEGFGINNLTEKFVAWTDRNYSITLGDFYEQFGSGLVLRSWEDRMLGLNNSLGGARVTFNIKDIVSGKVLYAFPRFNLGYLDTRIAGADLSFSLSNAIGLTDHALYLEGSAVNRHFSGEPDWYRNGVYFEEIDFKLPENVQTYSARVNYEYRGLVAKFEYVYKSKDAYNATPDGSYGLETGNAQLAELGYTGDGFAVMGQFRRLYLMEERLYRPDEGSAIGLLPGNTMNYIPALSPQHGYLLAGLDPNVPAGVSSLVGGEVGGQIDAYYMFKRGTALGGKRGLKIHANFSISYDLDAVTAKASDFRYRDFSFDIDKSWNSKLRTILFVSLQKNALHNTQQNIFVADVTYKFTRKFSLRGELQYNYAPDTEGTDVDGDWVAGLLEANFAPNWSVYVSDMYNNGGSKVHYYAAGVSFTHSFIRVALTYGRNRKGLICSGGVCREMPAYTGGNLSMTINF